MPDLSKPLFAVAFFSIFSPILRTRLVCSDRVSYADGATAIGLVSLEGESEVIVPFSPETGKGGALYQIVNHPREIISGFDQARTDSAVIASLWRSQKDGMNCSEDDFNHWWNAVITSHIDVPKTWDVLDELSMKIGNGSVFVDGLKLQTMAAEVEKALADQAALLGEAV